MKQKTKVLRILHRANVGGPTYHAAILSSGLNSDIFETKLLIGNTYRNEKSGEYILSKYDVEFTRVLGMYRSINPLRDIRALFNILKIIYEYQPDIIHTHASKAGFLGRLAGKIYGKAILIHTFHGHVFNGYWGRTLTDLNIKLERLLSKITNKIVVISDAQFEEIVRKYKVANEKQVSIIPLGLDLNRFADKIADKRKEFRSQLPQDNRVLVGIVGRLDKIKNHRMLIRAFAKVKQKYTEPISLLIVGDGPELDSLLQECKSLNLSYSYKSLKESCDIYFLSWRTDTDMIYAGLDVVTLTSINEGTPVSLIEAQVTGLPIVSTNVGGVVDVIQNPEKFSLVNSHNPEEFSEELLLVLKRLGGLDRNVCSKSLAKFGKNRLVLDVEELYKKELNI